jgi:RES domain.
MPAELTLVDPPAALWRVEWKNPPLRYSHISPVDASLDAAGNRFDVPGAGVLYAATDPEGAFAETTAHFRPKASLIAKMQAAANDGEAPPLPGLLDTTWRTRRALRSFQTVDALPFVDIEAPETHTYLTVHAARLLDSLHITNLDVSIVRGRSRWLTRGLAEWVYNSRNDAGAALFAGIRYISRLGDYECWAIFDGTEIEQLTEQRIDIDDPSLVAVAERHGLTLV